jgi:transposase
LRPLVRAVATAFLQATVELWAVDEHRIGLKPLLRRVWTPAGGPRPHAVVQHRFAWRYLVGFVHLASGRTYFHLASAVSIAVFEAELAAFARAVGAGPHKQIVLVLDQAGWHTSTTLRVPEHLHLLFPVLLPAYSPELQPAEHLWPLTDTVLLNRHFADLDEPEDAQARRCVALQARRDLIRSATHFPWWPLRIKQRQGPRAPSCLS